MKTYKAGYSQFIGELFNNNIIKENIIKTCIKLFIDNLEKIVFEDSPNEAFIEDNIICICNIIKTTHKNIDYIDINKTLVDSSS